MTLAATADSAADSPADDAVRSVGQGVAIIDTTELRWFAPGVLPTDVEAWFTKAGTVGAVEERCDRYRLDGQPALGVKRRFRTTLEMKMRQSVGERLRLDDGLVGRLEVWRKWSPVGGFADSSAPWSWIDVSKRVVKRRFSVGGDEIEHSSDADSMEAAGCDVELVAAAVGDLTAWSFAFAAFGPVSSRRDALLAAWEALCAEGAHPDRLPSSFTRSCGYPEWLTTVVDERSSVDR